MTAAHPAEQAVVRSERCTVRRFRAEDADAALAYLGDPAVMEFVEPCFDHDQAAAFIQKFGLRASPLVYAVERSSDDLLIGHVIFHPWGDDPAWELGWILRRDAWGQGFATELSRALIDHGFTVLGVPRIIAECHPANSASIAVIEKAGLQRAPELDEDLPVWSISRAR